MKCSELHKPAGHSGGRSKALRETTKFLCDVSLRHFALWTPQPAGWPEHEEESVHRLTTSSFQYGLTTGPEFW